ncbi:1522_t:CDS:2 [Dentiscutata erythropus]|uniref:1522_t:CDS:1 n=1 Tax=Dentiscutata erythropus TaxID=1348616 RepID=A0A9N9ESU8_9GLOM|nr:1522_t:CDS:2 [Dentiscutata erythropus]
MSDQKIKVLFVCLGNICRSPMAEAVFAHTALQKGLQSRFIADSAGTSSYHIGEPPHPRTIKLCTDSGIRIDHSARMLEINDFDEFDYIFCMDDMNLRESKKLMKSAKNPKATVKLFGEYDPQGKTTIEDINRLCLLSDPYHSGNEAYKEVFEQVTRCSEAFLQSLGF